MRMKVLELIDLEMRLNKRFVDGTLSSEVVDDLAKFLKGAIIQHQARPRLRKFDKKRFIAQVTKPPPPWEK